MSNDPRDATIDDMQAQLDRVSGDIDAAKHKIAQDTLLGLADELFGPDQPVDPHDDVTPLRPPA